MLLMAILIHLLEKQMAADEKVFRRELQRLQRQSREYPWLNKALPGVEDKERNFKRHLQFIGEFARPATAEQLKYHECICCKHKDELYYTQFEGSLPAWMCLSCIVTAFQRVKDFIEKRAFNT